MPSDATFSLKKILLKIKRKIREKRNHWDRKDDVMLPYSSSTKKWTTHSPQAGWQIPFTLRPLWAMNPLIIVVLLLKINTLFRSFS